MNRTLAAAALALAITVTPANAFFNSNGRPAHCLPKLWCGCWLADYFAKLGITFKVPARDLYVARNWRKVGRLVSGPAPGVIAVFSRGRGGHVGIVRAVPGPGRIVLLSANDGGAVRERERSSANVIAWVQP